MLLSVLLITHTQRDRDMDLEAMKAAFAAKGGAVKVLDQGVAYGVDKEVDKVKRAKAREDKKYAAMVASYERYETSASQREEQAREAFHAARFGGANQETAMDEYNYVRNRRG